MLISARVGKVFYRFHFGTNCDSTAKFTVWTGTVLLSLRLPAMTQAPSRCRPATTHCCCPAESRWVFEKDPGPDSCSQSLRAAPSSSFDLMSSFESTHPRHLATF